MAVKSPDDLFRIDLNHGPMHPRLRRWQQLKSVGYRFDLTIHRKWDGLTFSPARMFVTFRQHDGEPGTLEEVLWEEELNQGLVELGVQASDPANEVTRYALAFRSALDPVSMRHGQDYLRSVLVEFLRANDVFASHPDLKDKLDQVHPAQAYRGSGYEQALAAVESIIRAKAHELKLKLGYQEEVALDVLCRALAQYLDEIFHISARRIWFPR